MIGRAGDAVTGILARVNGGGLELHGDQLTGTDLALILEALEDAAVYRDARSHVLRSAVKRVRGRSPSPPGSDSEAEAPDVHRRQSRAYTELAVKLRRQTRS
jgi:hypothetical protein